MLVRLLIVGWLVALGSGLVLLETSVPFRQSLVYCPRGGLALAFYHCVPFWLDACQALRWGGLCLGLVGPHTAMALDLGRPLGLQCFASLVCWLSADRVPAGGVRVPSRSRRLSLAWHTRLVLHLLGASRDWLIVTRQAPDRGVACVIGFRPGTPGGFGAVSAVACVLPPGGLALVFCHCVPLWRDACQALRWGGLYLGLFGAPSAMALDLGCA